MKWKIKWKDICYFTDIVEADTQEEAIEKVCEQAWKKHRHDVYEVLSTEVIKGENKPL